MVLYRKYRPQKLSEVVGQEHIKEPLLASLKRGKVPHALLLTGPRGTGKTSVARIIAKAVNCEKRAQKKGDSWSFSEPCNACITCKAVSSGSHLDVMEIDAASNRGIDEIRDLREKVRLLPSSGNFKVYIIDEAHMLTTEAFNALLKTLEEPPPHSLFILATTEPHKIPATIASRSTHYDFNVPSIDQIREKLAYIAKKEGWGTPEESLKEIASLAAGAFRDAEVLLEKIASYDPKANLEKIRQLLGKKETKTVITFLKFLQEGKAKEALTWLSSFVSEGGSVRVLSESVLDVLRKILLIKAGAERGIGALTEEEDTDLRELAKQLSKQRLLVLVDLFNKSISDLRDASIPQLPLEIAVIEATIDLASEEPREEEKDKEVTQDREEMHTHKEKTRGVKDKKENTNSQNVSNKKVSEEDLSTRKSTKSSVKLIKRIEENWPAFLKEVKKQNSSVEMFLRNATPAEVDEDLLMIEFPYKFHKSKIEEKKYKDLVEGQLQEFFGTALRIKGLVSKKAPDPKKENSAEVPLSKQKDEVDPVSVFGHLD
ncbi:MAG: DNA polymerase III subunit gamma/tau [Candidatus Woykebacteria bacterium]